MSKRCQQGVWLRAIDEGENTVYFTYKPCKTKNCPKCALQIAKNHKKRVAMAMIKHHDYRWFFVTTTLRGKHHKKSKETGVDSLPTIRLIWSRFRKRLARSMGKDMLWLRVYEQHETGVWHVHLIVGTRATWWASDGIGDYVTSKKPVKRKQKRQYVITKKRAWTDRRLRWIRNHWVACGGGYMVDMQPLKTGKKARAKTRYVIKYILKTYLQTSRTGEYSRNFDKLKETDNAVSPDLIWVYVGRSLSGEEIKYWDDLDYDIEIKGI